MRPSRAPGADLVTTTHEIPVAELPPALDGLRILQISDLHDTRFGPEDRDLLGAVAASRADLIALTGDVLDHGTEDLAALGALAPRLAALAPCLVVPGNHEGGTPLGAPLLSMLAETGMRVLRDEIVELGIRDATLRVAGIDDPRLHGGTPSRPFSPALDRALARRSLDRAGVPRRGPDRRAARPPEAVHVLLAHRPELIDLYAERAVDVVLAGHAHGGQWRPPRTQGLYAPNQRLLPRLTAGVHDRAGMRMVISRGLKVRRHLPRLNNPPELVLVVLHRA